MNATDTRSEILDVRGIPKPRKHPTIFDRYASLDVGESFILVNDHNPIHLHEEFETDYPGSYGWEYLSKERRDWQIRITKRATTALPRVLVDVADLPADAPAGAVWSIRVSDRDLDSNIIALPAGEAIDPHTGPDLDVLIHVLSGSGTLVTERGDVALAAGAVAFLPKRSRRGFTAGPDGLRYLTVHQRRATLSLLTPTRPGE